jgi:Na+-driven multidrug efflux pump
VVLLFGEHAATLFLDKDKLADEAPVIIKLSRQYLITVTAFYFLVAIVNTVRFTIQGMGFSNFAMIAGLMEMIARSLAGLVLIPLLGFTGACFSSPLAWIFADAFLIPAYYWCKKKLNTD